MTFDKNKNQIILFSGRYGDKLYTNTWSWNGTTWTHLTDIGPTRRGIYSLVFDSEKKQLLFHGSGLRKNQNWILYNETWFCNGSKLSTDSKFKKK